MDSFQGKEAPVVIVDTVAAKDKSQRPLPKEEATPEDAEDFGGEGDIKVRVATGHVRSSNRLSVALTRGKDATIVVCQGALLAAIWRRGRKLSNALAKMISDATTRNCILEDTREDV